jgi:hypothetical protein
MKKLITILLFVAKCFSQVSYNTTSTTLVTNKITLGIVPLPAQYNIGQTSHLIKLITSNQPTKSCPVYAAPSIVLRFQGSMDNVNFSDIGAPITYTYQQPDTTFGALRAYSGYYPFLQANLQTADTTNCQHTIIYSGSLSGSFNESGFRWQDLGYVTINSALVHASLNALTNGAPAGSRIAVYAVSITGDGTNAMNAVTICKGTDAATIFWRPGTFNNVAAQQYVLPFTGKAYFTSGLGDTVGVNIAGGTGDAAVASMVIRYE